MLCEGFKPIGRRTLGWCGTNPLDCFFVFEKDTGLKHTHTWGSGNLGLISHNSPHTKASNSWMLCEGFKPIRRHTLGRCGTNPLDCFFWERHKIVFVVSCVVLNPGSHSPVCVCFSPVSFSKKAIKWVCPTSPKCVSPNGFKAFTQHSRVTGFCMLWVVWY